MMNRISNKVNAKVTSAVSEKQRKKTLKGGSAASEEKKHVVEKLNIKKPTIPAVVDNACGAATASVPPSKAKTETVIEIPETADGGVLHETQAMSPSQPFGVSFDTTVVDEPEFMASTPLDGVVQSGAAPVYSSLGDNILSPIVSGVAPRAKSTIPSGLSAAPTAAQCENIPHLSPSDCDDDDGGKTPVASPTNGAAAQRDAVLDDTQLAVTPATVIEAGNDEEPLVVGRETGGEANGPNGIPHLNPLDEMWNFTVNSPNDDVLNVQLSSSDLFHEVKQILIDRDSTCHRTCFSLRFKNKPLDAFAELRSVPELGSGNESLSVVEEPYNLRESRIHVRHIRDILSLDPSDSSYDVANASECHSLTYLASMDLFNSSSDAISLEYPPDYCMDEKKFQEVNLSHLLLPQNTAICALRNLATAPNNPPLGNRRMKGDLMYLVVDTVEQRRFYITSSVRGFFVNASTSDAFNPEMAKFSRQIHHSLVDLLKVISLGFKKLYPALLKRRSDTLLLVRTPTPFPVYSWFSYAPKIKLDGLKAEDSLQPQRVGFEDYLPGQVREWNEEMQSCHEMDHESLNERILRDRAIFKVHADFVNACVRGAQTVVEGNLLSINGSDEPKTQMYLWNNIFYSLGWDVKDHYKDCGGDAAAHAATSADLQGLRSLTVMDNNSKIRTIGMVIVDYRGYRSTGQSIIPGILEKEQENSVVYGSIDFGKTIAKNPTHHEALEEIARALHLRPHKVIATDKEGNEKTVELYTSCETKGIAGNDGRQYVLDLFRVLPPDPNFIENNVLSEKLKAAGFPRKFPHKYAILRQMLLDSYVKWRRIILLKRVNFYGKLRDNNESEDVTREDVYEETLADDEDFLGMFDMYCSKYPDILERAINEMESYSPHVFDLRFNPDCFLTSVKHAPEEDLETQQKQIVHIAEYLYCYVIPSFINECCTGVTIPADSEAMIEVMHIRGINVRYLGDMLKMEAGQKCFLAELLALELLARCVKHYFRKLIQDVPLDQSAIFISHFFNCLFGNVSGDERKKKKKIANPRRPCEYFPEMYTKATWAAICADANDYYGYAIEQDNLEEYITKHVLRRIPILRRICRIIGVQILLKDYKLSTPTPFQPEDILNIYPLFRHKNPTCRDARTLLFKATNDVKVGRIAEAFELTTETIGWMNTVYGPVHPELCHALRVQARISFIMGNSLAALNAQHRATVMSERCNGIDSQKTLVEYLNLAHYSFTNLFIGTALKILYRSRYILLLMHGSNHPFMAQIDGNIGIIFFGLGDNETALKFFKLALQSSCALKEPSKLKIAFIHHLVSSVHGCDGDYRAALLSEKETFTIYRDTFGLEHPQTRESSKFLAQLTRQAVEVEKRTKLAQLKGDKYKPGTIHDATPPLAAIMELMNLFNSMLILGSVIAPSISPALAKLWETFAGDMQKEQEQE